MSTFKNDEPEGVSGSYDLDIQIGGLQDIMNQNSEQHRMNYPETMHTTMTSFNKKVAVSFILKNSFLNLIKANRGAVSSVYDIP